MAQVTSLTGAQFVGFYVAVHWVSELGVVAVRGIGWNMVVGPMVVVTLATAIAVGFAFLGLSKALKSLRAPYIVAAIVVAALEGVSLNLGELYRLPQSWPALAQTTATASVPLLIVALLASALKINVRQT